jgi:hypothetical protein
MGKGGRGNSVLQNVLSRLIANFGKIISQRVHAACTKTEGLSTVDCRSIARRPHVLVTENMLVSDAVDATSSENLNRLTSLIARHDAPVTLHAYLSNFIITTHLGVSPCASFHLHATNIIGQDKAL